MLHLVLAQYPSLSVAVVRDGEIVYQGAFGFADLEARRQATPETSYHVASVTKAFTATLAVLLHDRGVVDLDRPVVTYLPEGVSISTDPDRGATITLRQLASHTSGLPRGCRIRSNRSKACINWNRIDSTTSTLRPPGDVTLASDPGADELYSNLGMGLLGHALECAADKPARRGWRASGGRAGLDANSALLVATFNVWVARRPWLRFTWVDWALAKGRSWLRAKSYRCLW